MTITGINSVTIRGNVRGIIGMPASAGGNVLLHMATKQPDRITSMVLVSATPYFPAQARAIMSQYGDNLPEEQWEILRRRHPGGDAQIKAIFASTKPFAASRDDLNFTPPLLSTIKARTSIIQGDRDPLYPVELSVEMFKAIPSSASGSSPTPATARSSAPAGPSSSNPLPPSAKNEVVPPRVATAFRPVVQVRGFPACL